jgi:hypothetical protein
MVIAALVDIINLIRKKLISYYETDNISERYKILLKDINE